MNASGAATTINTYDEFGLRGSSNAGRFQFTAAPWLPEVALYHMRARAYSPTLGRFLQTDPILHAGGMNLYAYVGNDPINSRDPLGLCERRTGSRLCASEATQFYWGIRDQVYGGGNRHSAGGTSLRFPSDEEDIIVIAYRDDDEIYSSSWLLWQRRYLQQTNGRRAQRAEPPPNTPPRSPRALERGIYLYGNTHRSNSGYLIGGYAFTRNGVATIVVGRIDATSSARGLRALDAEIVAAARAQGAHRVEIYGLAIQNQGLFNPRVAARYGYTHEVLPEGNIRLSKPVW